MTTADWWHLATPAAGFPPDAGTAQPEAEDEIQVRIWDRVNPDPDGDGPDLIHRADIPAGSLEYQVPAALCDATSLSAGGQQTVSVALTRNRPDGTTLTRSRAFLDFEIGHPVPSMSLGGRSGLILVLSGVAAYIERTARRRGRAGSASDPAARRRGGGPSVE